MTRMEDEDILELINCGRLRLRDDGILEKWHSRRRRFHTLVWTQHDSSGRFRVMIRTKDKSRLIYRNRILWIYHHRKVPPPGYYIDHCNGDRTDDRIDNIALMSKEDSRKQGYDAQMEWSLHSWRCFLDWIDFTETLPPEDSVLWQ